MRTRILPLLITMLFALSLASNAAANENSSIKTNESNKKRNESSDGIPCRRTLT